MSPIKELALTSAELNNTATPGSEPALCQHAAHSHGDREHKQPPAESSVLKKESSVRQSAVPPHQDKAELFLFYLLFFL